MQFNLEETIRQIRNGDHLAFRRLVEYYQYQVFVFVFRMIGQEEEARDIVQEVFIRVWKYIEHYDFNRKFSTWLFTIAARLSYDRLKSFRWQKMQSLGGIKLINDFQSVDNVEASAINSDLAGMISKLTDKLTPRQKMVFVLRDLEDLEVEEVILITGLSAEKIKSNLYLARQFIREKLEKM